MNQSNQRIYRMAPKSFWSSFKRSLKLNVPWCRDGRCFSNAGRPRRSGVVAAEFWCSAPECCRNRRVPAAVRRRSPSLAPECTRWSTRRAAVGSQCVALCRPSAGCVPRALSRRSRRPLVGTFSSPKKQRNDEFVIRSIRTANSNNLDVLRPILRLESVCHTNIEYLLWQHIPLRSPYVHIFSRWRIGL